MRSTEKLTFLNKCSKISPVPQEVNTRLYRKKKTSQSQISKYTIIFIFVALVQN